MTVTSVAEKGHIDETPPVTFAADIFQRAMRARGYRTIVEQAKAAGLDRQTYWRLRNGDPSVRLPVARARIIADAAGLTIDELFPRRVTR